jgi:Predicted glycosyltransferase
MSADFAILAYVMSSDTPPSQPSGRDCREYYRITVVLPIRIQSEADSTEGEFTEQSINISGGGIGVTVTPIYRPGEVLSITLLLPEQVLFKSAIEVLRVDPVQPPGDAYRVHARFVGMTAQNRELLIRYIVRFQRDHLQEHYSV